MKCISIMEPYASALIFGFKPSELRNFRIEQGECLIHVSASKIGFPKTKLHEYYRSIGANLTADVCLLRYNKQVKTDRMYIENNLIEITNLSGIDKKDYDMCKSLFYRNSKAQNNIPYLYGQIIGSVEFYGCENSTDKKYKFANLCEKGKLFSLKDSIFTKGRLGMYQVDYNQ
jgi:hypothetical protein